MRRGFRRCIGSCDLGDGGSRGGEVGMDLLWWRFEGLGGKIVGTLVGRAGNQKRRKRDCQFGVGLQAIGFLG